MSHSLKENATHITNLKGTIERRTTSPTDSGVNGLSVGRMHYRTDTDYLVIRTSSTINKSAAFTTTSTSTTTS